MKSLKQTTTILSLVCSLLAFSAQAEAGRFFIIGIDETGSYDLRSRSMAILENFILEVMQPGDAMLGRRITDKSYLDTPEIQLLPQILLIPEMSPAKNNTFDLRAKRQAEAERNQQSIVRLQAIKHLRALKPVKAPRTDIHGFFAAAADRLAMADNYAEKYVIVASDMIDNQKLASSIDLRGARVVILAFQKDFDPKKTMKTREYWEKTITAMKASSVLFLNPEQDITVALSQGGS